MPFGGIEPQQYERGLDLIDSLYYDFVQVSNFYNIFTAMLSRKQLLAGKTPCRMATLGGTNGYCYISERIIALAPPKLFSYQFTCKSGCRNAGAADCVVV